MDKFKLIIVEDVPLELKGTEGIVRNEIPEAEVIGTADDELSFWRLIKKQQPDLVLLDLGLGGSTTVGVEICRQTKEMYPQVKILIFTGEILNEKLWVDVLDAGADGIILKSGELLTRHDVRSVMEGKQLVFNEPILKRIVERFKRSVSSELASQEALIDYEIDEYDERFLRHLALGYTKEQITTLRGMPFGVKSLEKRQNELVKKLFPGGESVNAPRLVVRALELHILDIRFRVKKLFPYIALALALAQLLLILTSWVWSAAMPLSGVRSMLSSEGIRWYLGHFAELMASPFLVWLLLGAMAYGAVVRCRSLQGNSYRSSRARLISMVFLHPHGCHPLWRCGGPLPDAFRSLRFPRLRTAPVCPPVAHLCAVYAAVRVIPVRAPLTDR